MLEVPSRVAVHMYAPSVVEFAEPRVRILVEATTALFLLQEYKQAGLHSAVQFIDGRCVSTATSYT